MTLVRLLHAEDSSDDSSLIVSELKRGGFELTCLRVDTKPTMRRALEEQTWDAIISDFRMPEFDGLAALALVKELNLDIPFLVVSGAIGEEQAVNVMKAGANDYIMKNNLTRLAPALRREISEHQRRREAMKTLREREEQLREAQKLEAIAQLAGGLAHDFNNIMGVIGLQAEGVVGENLSPAAQVSMAEIQKAVDRASRLVRQLLTIGRRQPFCPSLLDLNEVATNLESMLRIALGEGSTLTYRLDRGVPRIRADQGQLEQVLMNLAVNARDAMNEAGEVSIETRVSEGRVQLTFRDNGCGMNEETKWRIFDPFFTTKELGKGSGLGLSTVFGIIKQHGGEIRVESQPEKGTAFHIYFLVN